MSLLRRRMMATTPVRKRTWMEVPFDIANEIVLWGGTDTTFRSWKDWSNTPPLDDDVRIYGARQITEATAYWTVFCVTTYCPQAVIGQNRTGVKVGSKTNVVAENAFVYNGQTWYYSGYRGYALPQNRTELNPACIDLAVVTGRTYSNGELEQAAKVLLDYYYGVI